MKKYIEKIEKLVAKKINAKPEKKRKKNKKVLWLERMKHKLKRTIHLQI